MPNRANVAGASAPSTSMPREPVPTGPRASQLDAAMLSCGSLCSAMRSSRIARMLSATGTE